MKRKREITVVRIADVGDSSPYYIASKIQDYEDIYGPLVSTFVDKYDTLHMVFALEKEYENIE